MHTADVSRAQPTQNECGPGGYEVIDLETGDSRGTYESFDEARGCVEFDRLTRWQIWRDGRDRLVDECDPGPTAAELLARAEEVEDPQGNMVPLVFATVDEAREFWRAFKAERLAEGAAYIRAGLARWPVPGTTVTPIASLDRPRYLIEGLTEEAVRTESRRWAAGYGPAHSPVVSPPLQRPDGTWVAEASRAQSAD